MTMKVECDNCHTEIVANTPAMNGWLMVQQVVMFQQIGDGPAADGNFCTISCTIEFLQKKQPRMEDMDGGPGESKGGNGGGGGGDSSP